MSAGASEYVVVELTNDVHRSTVVDARVSPIRRRHCRALLLCLTAPRLCRQRAARRHRGAQWSLVGLLPPHAARVALRAGHKRIRYVSSNAGRSRRQLRLVHRALGANHIVLACPIRLAAVLRQLTLDELRACVADFKALVDDGIDMGDELKLLDDLGGLHAERSFAWVLDVARKPQRSGRVSHLAAIVHLCHSPWKDSLQMNP